jgi:N-acetylglucosaminyldiphosphoundecaprenol N-acetyl-beta-D-mannosaminyltransferase
MRVDATSYADATRRILDWARRRESRYVCAANVHMTMEAYDSPEFRDVVNAADLVTPDGVPLVWVLRRLGLWRQTRVYGPDLMLAVCDAAARAGLPLGFYGGQPADLSSLVRRLAGRYPGVRIVYQCSPPFRPLTGAEDEADVASIHASGVRVLFVGLGCPKQERWMAGHRGRVEAVMVGVGAAFAIHAGTLRQAPRAIQRMGLEWLFRLAVEPSRLWRRYARNNPRFLILVARQLIRARRAARLS